MSTEPNQSTIAELVARIEDLEGKLQARRRPRRFIGGRVPAIMASITLGLGVAVVPSFAGAAGPAGVFWKLGGNAGTNPSTTYLGTSDNAGLSIRTNGAQAIGIDTTQNVTVAGSLNAQGGLQENGTPLRSEYATVTGSNATGTWPIGVTGNAGSVTNGLYSTGSYSDPPWLTSLSGTKISGNISGNAAGFTGSLGGDVTGTQGATQVSKLQGKPLSASAPTSGQVLTYDGSHWAAATLPLASAGLNNFSSVNISGATFVKVASTTLTTAFTGSIVATGTVSAAVNGTNQSNQVLCELVIDNLGTAGPAQDAAISSMTVVTAVSSNGSTLTITSGSEQAQVETIPTTVYATNESPGVHTVSMYCAVPVGSGSVDMSAPSIVAVATR